MSFHHPPPHALWSSTDTDDDYAVWPTVLVGDDDYPFGRPEDFEPGDFTGVALLAALALLLAAVVVRLVVQVVTS